jgi:hypothetical protein
LVVLLRRLTIRLHWFGAPRRLALPPPAEPAEPVSIVDEIPTVIVLAADPAAERANDRPPPDPARRARYFTAAYVTPLPPGRQIAGPSPEPPGMVTGSAVSGAGDRLASEAGDG